MGCWEPELNGLEKSEPRREREREREGVGGGVIHGVWRHIPACLKALRGTNMHLNYGGGDKSRMLTGKVLGAGDRVDAGGAGKKESRSHEMSFKCKKERVVFLVGSLPGRSRAGREPAAEDGAVLRRATRWSCGQEFHTDHTALRRAGERSTPTLLTGNKSS